MPRCCAAAGCSSVSGKRYSLYKFPCDDALRANLMSIGCKTAANWLERTYIQRRLSFAVSISRPTVSYAVGIPAKKWLKPNAIPTIFPNPLIVTVNQLRHPKDLLPKGINVKQ